MHRATQKLGWSTNWMISWVMYWATLQDHYGFLGFLLICPDLVAICVYVAFVFAMFTLTFFSCACLQCATHGTAIFFFFFCCWFRHLVLDSFLFVVVVVSNLDTFSWIYCCCWYHEQLKPRNHDVVSMIVLKMSFK